MNVWAEDEAVAVETLSPSAQHWLGSLDQAWGVEVRGTLAVVYGPSPGRPDPASALEALGDLIDHLPAERAPANAALER